MACTHAALDTPRTVCATLPAASASAPNICICNTNIAAHPPCISIIPSHDDVGITCVQGCSGGCAHGRVPPAVLALEGVACDSCTAVDVRCDVTHVLVGLNEGLQHGGGLNLWCGVRVARLLKACLRTTSLRIIQKHETSQVSIPCRPGLAIWNVPVNALPSPL